MTTNQIFELNILKTSNGLIEPLFNLKPQEVT